jgi:hypothetical protein
MAGIRVQAGEKVTFFACLAAYNEVVELGDGKCNCTWYLVLPEKATRSQLPDLDL